jgi:divalent metal cation (Fe/Co/Zn/Cd) transporter
MLSERHSALSGRAIAIEPGWAHSRAAWGSFGQAGVYLVVRRIGQQTHSPAINASARDNLADILTSARPCSACGDRNFCIRWPIRSPGLVVASWIFHSSGRLFAKNIRYLTAGGAPPELSQAIADAASTVEGVQNVHRVMRIMWARNCV